MIKVEIVKQPYTKKAYTAVISDDKGHKTETLPFSYGVIKKGLKKKNIDLPSFKTLQFDAQYKATVIIEGKMWGKEN